MRPTFTNLLILAISPAMLPQVASAQTAPVPAFIGAKGYGATAKGWRSSSAKIVFVTNLNDSGPGSFRQAYKFTSGPRYIIFSVGGYIPVLGSFGNFLSNSTEDGAVADAGKVYVAGQTAPGQGVTFKGQSFDDTLHVREGNSVIRFFRMRAHGAADLAAPYGLSLWGGNAVVDRGPIMIDHCTLAWSNHLEFASTWPEWTVQNCLFAEPRWATFLPTNNGSQRGTLYRNFVRDSLQRTPLLSDGQIEVVNNVFFNNGGFQGKFAEAYNYKNTVPAPTYEYIGNYFRWGPSSGFENAGTWQNPAYAIELWYGFNTGRLLLVDNRLSAPSPIGFRDIRILSNGQGSWTVNTSLPRLLPAAPIPVAIDPIDTQAKADAFAAKLLQHVGGSKPARDPFDQFMVDAYFQYKGRPQSNSNDEYDSIYTIANGGNPWPQLQSGAPLNLQPSGMTQEFITRMGLANTVVSALSTSISQSMGNTYQGMNVEGMQNLEWCLMEQAGDIAPLNGGNNPPPVDAMPPARPKNLQVKPS